MSLRPWLTQLAEETAAPGRVAGALNRLVQAWPEGEADFQTTLEEFPPGPPALASLLAASEIAAERIVARPELLRWLADPANCMARSRASRLQQDLRGESPEGVGAQRFAGLRRLKSREMIRIALRDVAGLASLEETTADLSTLASVCLDAVLQHWTEELTGRLGDPETPFTILGMGKLGGNELNYSSDIDLIFLYGEEGEVRPGFSRHQFFTRLAEKLIATFGENHPEGPLFRVDLRLRPEGDAGPLVRSLESMETYYAGFGETWERMVLIKTRGVAGDEELAYEFSQYLQPFIYPKIISTDILDEVAAVKGRIEKQLSRSDRETRHVKLGRGGIREIEFVTQSLQLLHGARHAFVQEPNTLKALEALAQLDIMDRPTADQLSEAYRFLRRVEHRLQMRKEQQTHSLPEQPEAMEELARGLGFPDRSGFQEELRGHTERVRGVFEKTMGGVGGETKEQAHDLGELFREPDRARGLLEEIGGGGRSVHVSGRTRRLFEKLEPVLLKELGSRADPDGALTRFTRFIQGYGIRGLLFESLLANPKLLELLCRLFDASRFGSELVFQKPQLIEEIARSGDLDLAPDAKEHLQRIEAGQGGAGEGLRSYRNEELLRILLRDLLEIAPPWTIIRELSDLAEACLIQTARENGLEEQLTVVGLGKFGGRELGYGSDLDVVFVGSDSAPATTLMQAMTRREKDGVLYSVDPRLRPEGDAGLLVPALDQYRDYFEGRAQFWEIQALTKSRPVFGPEGEAFQSWARERWARESSREDLGALIQEMLDKIYGNRGKDRPDDQFKTGRGGLITVEFTVQALQMRHRVESPSTEEALGCLEEGGQLKAGNANTLREAYHFFRFIESTLRRVDNSGVSALPRSDEERQVAIRRLGFANEEALMQRMLPMREEVDALSRGLLKQLDAG